MRSYERVWQGVTWFGGLFFFLFLMFLAAVAGYWHFAVLLGIGTAVSMVLTVAIRTFYFKHRPKKQKYKTYIEKIDSSSFPSLHAMRVWVAAVLVHAAFGGWLAVAGWCVAVLVSVSRFVLRRHFVVDIFVGAVLGVSIGLLLLLF